MPLFDFERKDVINTFLTEFLAEIVLKLQNVKILRSSYKNQAFCVLRSDLHNFFQNFFLNK